MEISKSKEKKMAKQMNKFIRSRFIPAFTNLAHSLSEKFQLF